MPNDNLLGIRDSKGKEIPWVPVLVALSPDTGAVILNEDEARLDDHGSKFDKKFRTTLERLLGEGYVLPTYVPTFDYWQLTGYWLVTNIWSVIISFGPGEKGSHLFAQPQNGWYPWEQSAYLARITVFKEGIHYGTKEFITPDETLEWLRDLIED